MLEQLSLITVPDREDLLAHQTQDVFKLWMAWEAETGVEQDIPYWATVWPAARLMAKFIQIHPEIVVNKNVLDFGCGCGIPGIAALKAGAVRVLANDIDPIALELAKQNAKANRYQLETLCLNMLDSPPPKEWEVMLIADLFYDRTASLKLLQWLVLARKQGSQVFIADAGRPFSPKTDVEVLAEETFSTNLDLEGQSQRRVRLLAFQP